MNYEHWIALIVITVITYLMRILPLLIVLRANNKTIDIPTWFNVIGSTMVAAMLGSSLIPSEPTIIHWVASISGGAVTFYVWYLKRSLGLPVFLGVIFYGATLYLI